MSDRLEQVKARNDAATPGPDEWYTKSDHDAVFASRADVPWLIAEVERLTGEAERLTAIIDGHGPCSCPPGLDQTHQPYWNRDCRVHGAEALRLRDRLFGERDTARRDALNEAAGLLQREAERESTGQRQMYYGDAAARIRHLRDGGA